MPIVLKRFVVLLMACGATPVCFSQKTTAMSAETQQHIKDVEAGYCRACVI